MVKVLVTSGGTERTISADTDRAMLGVLRENAEVMLAEIRQEARFHSRTGEGIEKIEISDIDIFGKNRYSVRVQTPDDKWGFVIYGVPPHTITPTSKQALAFFFPKVDVNPRAWKDPNMNIYKSVQHPGVKADNFVRRAVRRVSQWYLDVAPTRFVTLLKR